VVHGGYNCRISHCRISHCVPRAISCQLQSLSGATRVLLFILLCMQHQMRCPWEGLQQRNEKSWLFLLNEQVEGLKDLQAVAGRADFNF